MSHSQEKTEVSLPIDQETAFEVPKPFYASRRAHCPGGPPIASMGRPMSLYSSAMRPLAYSTLFVCASLTATLTWEERRGGMLRGGWHGKDI